ncbi:alpha/beta-hydrolase [Westerdykella ornata]|uniref:Alpha/beta-hydrolase n=1 Tax=Westerdykella ornata TaxID=318751 RepID=A0A6A6J7M6_WESOR|nr:alpha/beta-hydrolase [Westerdykella ornata]KAF2272008.1 alpha/beta-hydrolase [Westerdykella ornata]
MSLYSAIALPLACLSGVWIPATLLCCVPWLQKQMLYLHWVTLWPGKWLGEPERAGFLKNQVAPFRIPTSDGETLFAWLITPLGKYSRHAADFIAEKSEPAGDVESRMAFKLLRDDPEARLLIYFHGNTATVAQSRRTEEYRMYSSGASDHIFVLAFDYRGFGKSTGTPSEAGILEDAHAVVKWAMTTAKIPPSQIVLLGHSLGTAVACAIADLYVTREEPVTFAGVILCAAFTNSGNAFSAYSIGGVFPVLAPVKLIPRLQSWFSARMRDTWFTDRRLASLIRNSSQLRLVIVHSMDDTTMPWDQSEELFSTAIRAAADAPASSTSHQRTSSPSEPAPSSLASKHLKCIDLGEAGRQEVWSSGKITISKLIAKHGDHNTMMKWSPIALAVLECFGLTSLDAFARTVPSNRS